MLASMFYPIFLLADRRSRKFRGSSAHIATSPFFGRRNSRLAAPVGKSGVGHCVGVGRRIWSVIGKSLVVNPSQSMSLESPKFWLPERGSAMRAWQHQTGLALSHFQASARDGSELRAQMRSENFKHSSM